VLVGKVSSKHKHSQSRKDARKQEREAKKQRKAAHHDVRRQLNRKTAVDASIHPVPSHLKKRPASGTSEGESVTKKRRISSNGTAVPSTSEPSKPFRTSKQMPTDVPAKSKQKKPSKRLAPTIDDILASDTREPEDQDDKDISRLEYLLGLSKRRNSSSAPLYGAEFAEDGLDGAPAL